MKERMHIWGEERVKGYGSEINRRQVHVGRRRARGLRNEILSA